MTTLKKPSSRIIRLAEDNHLVLLDHSFIGEHLLEVLTKLIPDHLEIKSRDSIFIDVGTLIKCTDYEMIIAIASLKLFIEGYYSGVNTMVPAMFNQGYTGLPAVTTNDVDDIIVELLIICVNYYIYIKIGA